MIRAVLDGNVLVSGLPASNGAPAELVERWLKREFVLVLSEHILPEAMEAWAKPYWSARHAWNQVQDAMALMRERAQIVVPDVQCVALAKTWRTIRSWGRRSPVRWDFS